MAPITKNMNVIDEKGNKYEATYPKRARGLVKNGRARFVDENTICLACPPNIDLEDNIMNNDIFNPEKPGDGQIPSIPPIPPVNPQSTPLVVGSVQSFQHGGTQFPPAPPAYPVHNPLELNMEYVLSRIDMILKDTSYIHKALETIICLKPSESEYQGGQSDAGRAEAVTSAVQSRETTNQQALKLLEKMYDDLKPKSITIKDHALDVAERIMNNATLTTEEKNQLLDVFDSIRHIES